MAFRAREEALKRRDLELQESLLRFTRFLQENDAKRAKAQRRAADEERLRGEREAEIARLHGEAEACRAQKEAMQAQLAKVARWAGGKTCATVRVLCLAVHSFTSCCLYLLQACLCFACCCTCIYAVCELQPQLTPPSLPCRCA